MTSLFRVQFHPVILMNSFAIAWVLFCLSFSLHVMLRLLQKIYIIFACNMCKIYQPGNKLWSLHTRIVSTVFSSFWVVIPWYLFNNVEGSMLVLFFRPYDYRSHLFPGHKTISVANQFRSVTSVFSLGYYFSSNFIMIFFSCIHILQCLYWVFDLHLKKKFVIFSRLASNHPSL